MDDGEDAPGQRRRARRSSGALRLAEALRLLRTREGLTQSALSKLPGAPDFRSISHWETGRKLPAIDNLHRFLAALGFDFRDLQDALDQIGGRVEGSLGKRLVALERRTAETEREMEQAAAGLHALEQRLAAVEKRQE